MTDYISRDVAIIAAFMADGIGNSEYRNVCDIAERLRKIPAADVVERKHGEWVQVMGKYDWMYVCSKCRFVPIEVDRAKYCPNCGADMRGDNDV